MPVAKSETDTPNVEYDNVAGNFYDKYSSQNPVVQWIMTRFLDAFDRLVQQSGAHTAHEIGCGEGNLTLRLARAGIAARGCDVSKEIITLARAQGRGAGTNVEFEVRSLYELRSPADASELIVCCEVLEHVPDPERALERLAALAQPYLIASVPREPLWRLLNLCRLRYFRTLGNTPGHIQHWGTRGFLTFLRQRFDVLAVETPLPWTMVLCRSRIQ